MTRAVSTGLIWVLVLASGFFCLGAEKPNIVVEDNLIAENGLGIYLGWYGNWYIQIVGNRIERNGEGIRIVNRKAFIEGNLIADNVIGVRITPEHEEEIVTNVEWVTLRGNSFVGNELYALQNLAPIAVDARKNWWGANGPRLASYSRWILVPWILPQPGITPPITLHTGLTVAFTDIESSLLLEGLGFCWEPILSPDQGKMSLDVRDLWGWRVFPLPETISLSGNLVMGPVEYGDWLTRPVDREGGQQSGG